MKRMWMAVAVGCVAAAARLAWPASREADLTAVLTLLSSLGLVLHAHSLVVDVAPPRLVLDSCSLYESAPSGADRISSATPSRCG